MKKFKKAISLVAIMMSMSAVAVAQNGLSVRAGGNFPVGTFGQGEGTNIALVSSVSELGGAATGFNVGLKYQLGVVGNLSAFASADLFYNGLNGDAEENYSVDVDGADVTKPAYLNIPAMLGLNYTIVDFSGTTLWVEAGAGVNFANISSSSVEYNAELPIVGTVEANSKSVYDMNATFAWQAGFGVSLSNTFSLGLHYYGFGKAPVSYETSIDASASNLGSLGIGNILGEEGKFEVGKVQPSMVVVRLGYTF